MNENKVAAKNLTTDHWIRWDGSIYAVRGTVDYGNGWWAVDLSDGRSVDCLAYRTFVTV